MALSDFQSKKLIHLFRTFFDTDHNGTIEKSDFDIVADKICKLRSWEPGSPQYGSVHQRLDTIWKEISAHDSDGDGHISEQEWLNLWADVLAKKGNGGGGAWIKHYQDFMFDAQDISGDGSVDENEFVTLYKCLGIPDTQCKDAFQKLTNGGDGKLTKDVFMQRFQEFISSDDKSAAGNYLFGGSL
ncbi:hypothetical protein RvY_15091 [Ramazzottius varieornatus]|uniref:EF-hand domain-containing protein n=1 Tax=Ramazzottius varieornatus TaxID=947166 RepID=A0A1D1W0N1_RAMVA|nr:hypothetical protein RvY_15091 [Ramazzottius varieornatus]